jgi:hypothetical protein
MSTAPITTLIASGLDAFSNLFDVRIMLPGTTTNSNHSIRANGFNPPELTHGFYPVDYKTIQLSRPNSSIEGERKFTIEFRMDAVYQLYTDLTDWKNKFVNPTTGGKITFGSLSGALAVNYGKVEVVAYKASTNSNAVDALASALHGVKWTFNEVICTKVGSPVFSREGTEAVTFSADFLFGTYNLVFA